MSMFKKIKSLFIEEAETPMSTATSSQASGLESDASTKPATGTAGETYTPVDISPGQIDKPDPKFIDILMKAIEGQNREGFDYLEFKNSLQSLSKLNMDEPTRYNSAFVMGKTMGLTKENLVQSVNHYVAVINEEEKKFMDALTKQKALQIQGKEEQLKTAEAGITQKQKQIQELQAAIENEKSKMAKISNEIKEAIVRIDLTNAQFKAAHKMISQQIISDLQNIKNYIE